MNKLITTVIFPIFNKIYKDYPTLYIPIYFTYKYLQGISTARFIKRWIKPGDTVVEVGSNIGSETWMLSRWVGMSGEVYAFEPDPYNFKHLKRNLSKSKNTYLNKMAVGDKNNYIKLYLSNDLNTDHQTFDIGDNRKSVRVKQITLDKYFPKKKKVRLIKIDVQGYDYHAFKGMVNLLSRSDDIALIGEFWPYALKRSGVSPQKYLNHIKKLGFKFVEPKKLISSKLKQEEDNRYFSLDFIATKP